MCGSDVSDWRPLYRYWGKAGDCEDGAVGFHPLVLHNVDVAAVAIALFDADALIARRMEALSPVPIAELRSLVAFFAAIHDMGKFSRIFQSKRADLCARTGIAPWGRACDAQSGHHTRLGFAFWKLFEVDFTESCGLSTGEAFEPLCNAAFGHHGEPLAESVVPRRFSADVEDDARAWFNQCAKWFLFGGMPGFAPVGLDDDWDQTTFPGCSWLMAGLLVLADWIGSNDLWFPYVDSCPAPRQYWDDATARARLALARTGVLPAAPSPARSFFDLLPHMPADVIPYPMQRAVLDLPLQTDPELLICEDLTGGGKTESALLVAHRAMRSGQASGLYVGLPTMATANAMYSRLSETYRALFASPDASLVAAHGGRLLNRAFMESVTPLAPMGLEQVPSRSEDGEDAGAVCSAWIADNRKKALLAPCGAGTLDQALLGILPSRHQALRLYGLARSVLIADEIHAYDDYTARLLERLLTFHAAFGGTAVLLSATLPHAMRARFIAAWAKGRELAGVEADAALPTEKGFPLLTRVTDGGVEAAGIGTTRTLNVKIRPVHDELDMYDAMAKAHRVGACACWIRNTVDDALAARRRLVEEYGIPEAMITLFHARYAGCDRAVIESDVLSRFGRDSTPEKRAGRILIATQVAEQSLDLDFDVLLSDLAPMELMIQRAGRCHRHKRAQRPVGFDTAQMFVLMPHPEDDADENWYAAYFAKGQYVYPNHALLWRTARLLRDRGQLVLPEDARALVEGAYQGDAPEGLQSKDDWAFGDRASKRSMAQFAALDFADGYARAGDGMRWDRDVKTPTRLGEETRQVRLVRCEPEGLRLWADMRGGNVGMTACLASELRIGAWKIAEPELSRDETQALTDFAQTLPDKAHWCMLLPLCPCGEGGWSATVRDGQGRLRRVFYGSDGLFFGEAEDV
ncbi:CRISPR-associated endonuclease/helicase Cas3 [Desulfobaculum xiamenense]|uniref:CRISPR-associated endonuclease/helicase Cas3 n=1 Tax=Desulfobaculum xiamenense TaxID=995050 RepID=A0A846QLI9_9BACT|nr:CRISPR-associated helicase Cas3' [Desulfobaculum xiamenense]NJB67910.1 CRISPR-associated endonuclease/helicase Cas3 [Desulfobaculum xiamenense]